MATELGKAYVQIIPSAKGISGSISSALNGEAGAAGESAGQAIVGKLKGVIAAAGIGKFLSDSISTGAEFDKSMSQVAATMGLTMDEMASEVGSVDLAWGEFSGNLRDYAQEMGANTAFSATQAADALNYMALAGYDAQTSMEMLPNVLNLAAAGGIDLAYASDMITDTQTALGLSIDRTSQLVDEMAKTASKSNTSVSQLGEAMLVIGATGRDMSGGLLEMSDGSQLAYDSTQSLSMALGVLADNGIKGTEGGTHLRNIIMSLSTPTDVAADAMLGLGLSVYDANGEMKPLIDILDELNASMDGMTDAEKSEIISTIFNKTDIAAVNSLLGTSSERWGELGSAIVGAEGAAQQMADTQLDNLAGDVTLFQSALEGVKIAISDALTPALREVVQLGSEFMTAITNAMTAGDISGLMAVGQTFIQGIFNGIMMAPERLMMGLELINGFLSSIFSMLPSIVSTGTSMVSNLMQGIFSQLPALLQQGVTVVGTVVQGILSSLPEIITSAGTLITQFVSGIMSLRLSILESGVQILLQVVNGIISNLPEIISAVIQVVNQFIATIGENLPSILEQGITILGELIAGLIQALPDLVVAIGEIIATFLTNLNDYDWLSIGVNIVTGIINGLMNMIDSLVEAVKELASSIWNSILDYFGIASPSKLMMWAGQMIDEGFAGGIEDHSDIVDDAITDLGDSATAQLTMAPSIGDMSVTGESEDSKLDRLLALMAEYLPQIASGQQVVLSPDAEGLFNVVQNQNKIYKRMNGESAFA